MYIAQKEEGCELLAASCKPSEYNLHYNGLQPEAAARSRSLNKKKPLN
jgi:hypothetical protein